MCERKAWTKEEDQLLLQIMQEQDSSLLHRKMKWNEIAEKISELTCKNARKGKQCRERWFNQLHPSLSKEPLWTHDQEKVLFKLQEEFGNHWAKISKYLPGRSDNNIKNYFYSCLRKALRKVNNFVNYNKRNARYKNLKPFQTSTLTKLLAVAQKKTENKIHIVKQEATNLAKQIKNLLVEIQVFQKTDPTDKDSELLTLIIQKIQNFNRICKRKKMKKKAGKKSENDQNCAYFKLKSQEKSFQSSLQDQDEDEEMQQSQNQDSLALIQKKEEQKNQPLQRSQPISNNNQTLSLRFPSTSSLDQSKKVRQPVIIPSCHYNCLPRQSPSLRLKNQQVKTSIQTRESGEIQMAAMQSNSKQFLPLIPVAHPAFYHGSAFMPTLYSTSPMLAAPQDGFLDPINPHLAPLSLFSKEEALLQSQKNTICYEPKNNNNFKDQLKY